MILPAPRWFPNLRRIRIRQPSSFALVTGADREAIHATYDEGNRLVHLAVHTRSGRLNEQPPARR